MKNLVIYIIIIILACSVLARGSQLPEPPQDGNISVGTHQYLKDIKDNFYTFPETKTNPNGSRVGRKLECVLFNSTGTYSLYVNTNGNKTWQAL